MKTELIEIVFDELSAIRVDKFLAEQIPGLSRAMIQTMISAGEVTVNGRVLNKSSYRLEGGDKIVVSVKAAADTALERQDIDLDVIYEDPDVVVINKPTGLVIHPGAGNQQDTLVNALLFHWPQIAEAGEPERPGVVHRLD